MITKEHGTTFTTSAVAVALACTLIASTGTAANAQSQSHVTSMATASAQDGSLDETGLTEGLSFIEDIPDSALTSQKAFDAWAEKNSDKANKAAAASFSVSRGQAAGAVSCGIAVTTAVVSNVFAVSKILKVKKAIEADGGATKFAKTAIAAYKEAKAAKMTTKEALEYASTEASKNAGKATAAAILDIFSVNAVLKDCFGVNL